MPDAKMNDEKAKDPKESEEKKQEEEEEEKPVTPPLPPLEAAARRLERLLGGGLSDKDRMLHTYSNPAKVVRRWLGTASGAAGNASLDDIAQAAAKLLDPNGHCATGRKLLGAEGVNASMEVEGDDATKASGYLSPSADREVEGWLISLSVRLLLKDNKAPEAFELSQKGIEILMSHLQIAEKKITAVSSVSAISLYPLLARMYRLRSLVAESVNDPSTSAALRQNMAKAHNMACLRRDVDCQATLLNLMLRDLLENSQGEWCQVLRLYFYSSNFMSYQLSFCSLMIKQSNKHRNSWPTRHFLNLRRITNSVAISTTAGVSRLCDWNTLLHIPI